MKRLTSQFFQAGIVLLGIGVLVFLLWEPHLEGRNVNATVFEIYFKDPFLAYVYLGSIPFFVALYQAYKALSSRDVVKSLRIIKTCALILIALIAGAELYFFIVMRGKDDIAGGVAMGLSMMAVSVIVAIVAGKRERFLRNTL